MRMPADIRAWRAARTNEEMLAGLRDGTAPIGDIPYLLRWAMDRIDTLEAKVSPPEPDMIARLDQWRRAKANTP
jgi:hypothetical protein